MKNVIMLLFVSLLLCVSLTSFTPKSARASGSDSDITSHKSCKYCGMDREKFAHSRMLIEYDDGSTVATCSLHCIAVDMANTIDKTPKAIKVADYDSKELVDAEKAVWVIGGSKQGVMSRNAKWAFATKEKADAFIKVTGGKVADFDEVIKTAYEDMYKDTKMIRDRRKHMKMKKDEQDKGHGMNH